MAIGRPTFGVLALALYVPVLVALAIGAGVAAHLGDPGGRARSWSSARWRCCRTVAPCRSALPEVGVLLAPVALGLALGAASARGRVRPRRAGRTFGWRQPAGILAVLAVAVGVVPRRVDR